MKMKKERAKEKGRDSVLGSGTLPKKWLKKTDQRFALIDLLQEWEGSWRKDYAYYIKMRVK